MYDIEKFYQAADVKDAVRALSEDRDALVICGGSDVLIKVREGKLAGCSLVSVRGLKELEGIRMEADGAIVIGAAETFSHITNHEIIKANVPVLGYAVDQAGGPQLRNVGTIGGNVCNGVTSADSAPSLCVLDAVLLLEGPEGTREVPISRWYAGPGKTVRQRTEVLTAIKIMKESYENRGGCYIKYGKRNAMEISTLGCAALIKLSPDKKRVQELCISYGVAAPTPIRCRKTEERVRGMELGGELLDAVSEGVLEEVNPRSSWRASREFRLQLVSELGRRAVRQAAVYAGGEESA